MSPDRSLRESALLVSVSTLLSGPVAMLVVTLIAPQPPWTDPDTFAAHYDPVQTLPYVLGFPLLAGFVWFVAACHAGSGDRHRVRTSAAMIFTAVYATMAFTNYMLQVALVPRVLTTEPGFAGALTMANPRSFAWLLEMFGYGALGVAIWLVSPLFAGSAPTLRWIRVLLIANAVMSVAGAILTATYDGFVFTAAGLAAFFVWNAVVIVCFGLIAGRASLQESPR